MVDDIRQAKHEAHESWIRTVVERIMAGDPVGHSTDSFNHRWAKLSARLTHSLASANSDPAVHLRTGAMNPIGAWPATATAST